MSDLDKKHDKHEGWAEHEDIDMGDLEFDGEPIEDLKDIIGKQSTAG